MARRSKTFRLAPETRTSLTAREVLRLLTPVLASDDPLLRWIRPLASKYSRTNRATAEKAFKTAIWNMSKTRKSVPQERPALIEYHDALLRLVDEIDATVADRGALHRVDPFIPPGTGSATKYLETMTIDIVDAILAENSDAISSRRLVQHGNRLARRTGKRDTDKLLRRAIEELSERAKADPTFHTIMLPWILAQDEPATTSDIRIRAQQKIDAFAKAVETMSSFVVPPIDQLRRTGKQLLENLNQTDRDHGRLFFQKLTAEHLRRLAVIDPEGMAADEASLMCLTLDERVGVALGIVVGFASTTTTPSPDDALSLLLREVANEIDGSGALEQDVVRLWQSATPNDYGTPRSSFLRLKDPKSFDDVLPQLHSDLVGRLSETKLDLLMQNLRATTGLGFSFKQRPDYIKQLRHRTYGSRHVSREESASSPWTRNTKFRQEAVKLVDEIHVEMLAAGNRTGLLDLAVQMFDVVPEAVDGALIHAFREGDMNLLRELAVVTAQPYDATSLDRTIAIAFSLGGHQSVFDILDQLPNGLRGVSRTQWPFGPDLRADVAQFDLWSELPQQLSTGVRNSCLAWQQFHAPPRLFERLDNSIGL